MKRAIDKKKVLLILSLTFLYLVCLALLVSGITLGALNYKHFEMYNVLVSGWAQYSGASSPGFQDYLNNYNSLAASNSSWVVADNRLFITGMSLLCIGAVLTSLTVWFQFKKVGFKKPSKKIKN